MKLHRFDIAAALALVAIPALAIAVDPAFAQTAPPTTPAPGMGGMMGGGMGMGGMGMGGMGHRFGGGPFGWFVGALILLAFIAVATVVVTAIARGMGFGGGHHHHPHGHGQVHGHGHEHGHRGHGRDALAILKERFARGEIDKADFEDRRRALGD